jgi:hypothetical protein
MLVGCAQCNVVFERLLDGFQASLDLVNLAIHLL